MIGENGSGDTPPSRTPSVGAILVMAALALLLGWGFYSGRRERRLTDQLGPTEAPRPGDILLFFRPNRARDHVIEWVTGSRFYHAALYAGTVGGSTEGTVIEARPRGVLRDTLRGRDREYLVLPAPQDKGAAALAWAETQLGAPFDDEDLLVIALEHVFRHWRINYTRPGRYTCGELVAAAFENAGVRLVPGKQPAEVAPADLAGLLSRPMPSQSSDRSDRRR